ncbi:MAG TPA: RNA polymerase subunit sigma [Candidatus Latescibacteria bacterium]|nr:RNA polymerase subunit sigma [Candidatus Latescibacterota bacterium]
MRRCRIRVFRGTAMPVATASQKEDAKAQNLKRTALELYLKDIAYNTLLTPQQEFDLAVRIRSGDRKSLEKMVESNLRFVITISKEYQGRGLPLEDLIAEGNVGLVRAATRYDETVGVKFTTYAVWWIRQGILSALAEKARMVRLPVNKIKHLCRLERIASGLKQELGREPNTEEVAKIAEMQPKQVQDLLDASRWHVSLDSPLEEGPDTSLLEIIEDKEAESPERVVMRRAMIEEIRSALETLSPREAQILKMYFGINGDEPMTLEQIGNQFSLTKERVRQIRDKALLALKHPSRMRRIKVYLGES